MKSAKVLLVDDEPEILDEMSDCLESEDIYCFTASDAKSAIEILEKEEDIDAIITDIRMPGMSGLEFTHHVKESDTEQSMIGIVILTGHAAFEEAIEALKAGAEDFLSKPIEPDQLLHSVRKAAEITRLRRTELVYKEFLAKEVYSKTAQSYELEKKVADTERKLVHERQSVVAATKAKDEFFSLISHELRTPLFLIQSFSEQLSGNLQSTDDAENREIVGFIQRAAKDALKYLDAVLSISSLEPTGEGAAEPQQISAADLFDTITSAQTKHIRDLRMEVTVTVPDGFMLYAQRGRLMQACNFLLEEALEHGNGSEPVYLAAQRLPGEVRLSFSRSGPEMPRPSIDLLTKSPEELDLETLKEESIGTRLGLALARVFVVSQGGHIEVTNETAGVNVTVVLPDQSSEDAN